MKGKSCHPAGTEHPLHLAAPDRYAAISVFFNAVINSLKSRRPVMLGPVKLDPSRNPWACQPDQGWFDYLVIIDKVALFGFVEGHLDPPAQFRKDHDFQVLVFQINGIPLLIRLQIRNLFYYRVRIDYTTTSLVDALFQKHRIFLRISDFVGRNIYLFIPGMYLPLPLKRVAIAYII